jgi:wyosine [tRNA(Phe)-imidazoG37] synthetase (radical SAM superfamily)
MLLTPKPGVIYGPVSSRRLGRSLGINLLPPNEKPCTFDCVYCQYGWTKRGPMPSAFPTVEQVLLKVESALMDPLLSFEFVTFSGNGEPTTHLQFPEIVQGVVRLRDRHAPSVKTAVLSNSTRVHDPAIRSALTRLDRRILKLDAGTEEVFQRTNRPVDPMTLAQILDGLRQIPAITIQTLFAAGREGNADAAHIEAWIEQLVPLRPVAVQLYTLDRDWPSANLRPIEPAALDCIAVALHARGCPAEVFIRS